VSQSLAAQFSNAGCTLDIIAEWVVFAFGWTIAGSKLWPEYILDFSFAYVLGIVFQYFTVVPMRKLPPSIYGKQSRPTRLP
jgi:apolipoprotein N-acyltransferase